jgi:hypothetical protein
MRQSTGRWASARQNGTIAQAWSALRGRLGPVTGFALWAAAHR